MHDAVYIVLVYIFHSFHCLEHIITGRTCDLSDLFLEMKHVTLLNQRQATCLLFMGICQFLLPKEKWTLRVKLWLFSVFYEKQRAADEVIWGLQEELSDVSAEVLPSAACWPALGIASVSLPHSQRAQINRQAELSGSRGPPPPPRGRIIPPLCRPWYHHCSSNKTAFHTQTPRGGRHRPNNSTAQRISARLPAAREPGTDPTLNEAYCTSSSLSLLSCCSRACHLSRVKAQHRETCSHSEEVAAAQSERVSGLKTKLGSVRDAWPRPPSLGSEGTARDGEGRRRPIRSWLWGGVLGEVFITAWLCSSSASALTSDPLTAPTAATFVFTPVWTAN